eukprot:175411-Chlamydomonas_euryale.AAC.1
MLAIVSASAPSARATSSASLCRLRLKRVSSCAASSTCHWQTGSGAAEESRRLSEWWPCQWGGWQVGGSVADNRRFGGRVA